MENAPSFSGVQFAVNDGALSRRSESRALHVVLLGDSLAYGTGDEADGGIGGRLKSELRGRGFTEIETTNLGVNGATTVDLVSRLKTERVRKAVAGADAIVLSIGANDLFRTARAREDTLRAPMTVAKQILTRIASIVSDLRGLNRAAQIMILGGYNPVPAFPLAPMIDGYLALWDRTLGEQFADDPLVSVVKIDDIVVPERLSRYDHFHPGAAAYEHVARRIADMLLRSSAA